LALLIQIRGHLQMMHQRRVRGRCPRLEGSAVAAIAATLEKIDGVLVGGFLVRVILLDEVVALLDRI
jgi:hypothetical protein